MGKNKIMFIDDEEEFLKLVKLNLEDSGKYEVATFLNAKNIVEHVHREKPDVILLDLLMPNLGGIEACEMLNDDPFASGIPLIIISGLAKDADKLKAYRLGVVDYLVKPVELEHLIASIEKAVKLKTAA